MCNFAYAKCTPEFHGIVLLAGCMWPEKGQLSGGPFFSITTINLYFQIEPFCSIHLNKVLLNSADLCETLLTWTRNKLTIGWVLGAGKYSPCIFFLGKLLLFYIIFCIKNKTTCLPGILPHGKFSFSWWIKSSLKTHNISLHYSGLGWNWRKAFLSPFLLKSSLCPGLDNATFPIF